MIKKFTTLALFIVGNGLVLTVSATDFEISGATTSTNGGNTLSSGDTVTVTSDGSITTTGDNNDALESSLGNTLTNNGTLLTDGINSHGIYSTVIANKVENTGTITTTGNTSYGVYLLQDSHTLTNTGTINTEGVSSHGVHALGNSNTIINNGTITTEGNNSYGISADGTFNTVTNSGTITSENGFSISMTGTDATLNLEQGSVLIGDVYFSSTESTLNVNTGSSAVIQLDGTSATPDTINVTGVYTISDDTIYVAELSDYVAQEHVVSTMSRLLHNAVTDRKVDENGRWNNATMAFFNDSGDETFSAYSGLTFSGSFGADRADKAGVFGGLSVTQLEGDDNFESEAVSLYGGIYEKWDDAEYTLSAGLSHNGTTREQTNNTLSTGVEEAATSYLSLFIAPSLRYAGLLLSNDSLRLRYTGVYNGSHDFDFSDGDLSVDQRITHQVEMRLALQHKFVNSMLRYGFDVGYIDAGTLQLVLAGNSISTSTLSEEGYNRFFLNMALGNSQLDAGYSNDDELSVAFTQAF